ncbi:DUF3078 domain-containing protein [Chryseobacterium sp. T1]
MKKFLMLLTLLLFVVGFSQKKNQYQKVLDSIAQSSWNSAMAETDTLENTSIVNIKTKYRDTIIVDRALLANPQEIPITPFNMLNTAGPKRWFLYGQNSLIFNQSSFSNWYAGGNDNIGIIGKINYNLNYKNGKHFLENNVQLGYGFVSSTGQATRKTEDYINVSSNYGYEVASKYYLSTGFQFLSQFGAGYNYSATPDPTYKDRVSQFMAPGYLNLGVGLSYNPNENFQVIFRPMNGKFTFVLDKDLQVAGKFGLERDGQSLRTELGTMMNIIYRIKIYKDVTMVNQLNLFTNYLNHMERVDIAYSGVLNLKFNKLITTTVALDLVYDHDQMTSLQRKQTLGVGITYNLGYKLEREKTRNTINPFVK